MLPVKASNFSVHKTSARSCDKNLNQVPVEFSWLLLLLYFKEITRFSTKHTKSALNSQECLKRKNETSVSLPNSKYT